MTQNSGNAEPPRQRRVPGGRWNLHLLGGFAASNGDLHIGRLPGRAVYLLLARLVLPPQRPHRREELIDLLWPDCALGEGRNRLRNALCNLKALLEPPGMPRHSVLRADREVLMLVPGSVRCDAAEFEDHARQGRVAEARGLYRGELLPAVTAEWLDDERRRLQMLFERLGERPLRPEARSAQRVRSDVPAPAVGGLLPATQGSWVGREAEVQRLLAAARTQRLVTVTGSGGCGKTRLCIEAARRVAGFELVLMVPLADCRDAALITDHLRAVRTLQAGAPSTLEQVVADLEGRRVLLILDNLEQLADVGGPAVVATLLGRLPLLHLWVSSRKALGLPQEDELALQPLALPAADDGRADPVAALRSPSVLLFLDRARDVRADFNVHGRNVAAVVALCRLVEGLPLAIELAASRLRHFSPQAMCDALRSSWAALRRTGPQARGDSRHASLDHMLDWSWQLLTDAQQALLGAVTVFRGPWTPAAAAAVAAMAEDRCLALLIEVTRTSLLQRRPDAAGGVAFELLASVRDLVRRRCPAAALQAARARHRSHFLALAQSLAQNRQRAAEADVPNLVEALRTAAADGEAPAAVQLALALQAHWAASGATPDALDALRDAARQVPATTPGATRLLTVLGPLLVQAGHADEARQVAQQALQHAGDTPALQADALLARVNIAWRSDREGASLLADAERALALARQAGAQALEARALLQLGALTPSLRGDIGAALEQFAAARLLFDAAGDEAGSLAAEAGRLACLLARQDFRVVVDAAARGLDAAERLGHVDLQMLLFNRLGLGHEGLRQYRRAVLLYQRQLRVAWRHGMVYHLAHAMWNQCLPLARLRQAETAARLMAFSDLYWRSKFGPLTPGDAAQVEQVRQAVIAQIGAPAFRRAWAQGRRLTVPQGLALAGG